jgi:hypothetical protein
MSNGNDRNYVSFWFWMLALFVMAVPCVGVIMILVWALVGENESRKNFFRAVIAWALIGMVFWMGMMLLGFGPEILRQLEVWWGQQRR